MKLSLIALVFAATFTTSLLASACQKTVMGGCTQEPTHDTSSHMKSEIVNRVEPVKPAITNQANTSNTAKIGANKSSSTGNLIQTVNKVVIK
ncbi:MULTISPECIES: hypothetical protein [Methylotenera]|uniref:hypothetical protein n=1 Tax=Methylotenera TaxID=359407 RepID=UPI00035EBD21|nr:MULTISPECIES: hypothetical protein [Methylotenera]